MRENEKEKERERKACPWLDSLSSSPWPRFVTEFISAISLDCEIRARERERERERKIPVQRAGKLLARLSLSLPLVHIRLMYCVERQRRTCIKNWKRPSSEPLSLTHTRWSWPRPSFLPDSYKVHCSFRVINSVLVRHCRPRPS
jgi:hypothetical protein